MKMLTYFYIILVSYFFFIPVAYAEDFNLTYELNNGLTVKIKDTPYTLPQSEINSWFIKKYSLEYVPSYYPEIENNNFCLYQKSLICNLSSNVRTGYHLHKKSYAELDLPSLEKSISTLAQKVNKDPVNARLKIINGKVSAFSLSEQGIVLDEQKSTEKILAYLRNPKDTTPIDLPWNATEPEILSTETENIHIDNLLGEGHSNFRGSPKNRIFNINLATDRFNGILIKPNEEFSFVSVLGAVDGEHGYLPELVIKKDKTEPEFGGGICQVSTTAFRAAIYSGLKITARQNHAYPVSYYNPQGMDSTVYIPRPDLRFINNTPGYILIQTKIEGTELTFQFYGISDGRITKVLGPTILEKNPDGSMKTTFTQQIYDKNNNLISETSFKSNYESPNKYPHPASSNDILSEKPKNWSEHEWSVYKKAHNLP